MEVEFYKCEKCGNVIELLYGDENNITCCGEKMTKLEANTVDAAAEKHVPFYEVDGDIMEVRVGEVMHPMEENHYIMWIVFVTNDHVYRVNFKPGEKVAARIPYDKGTLYAYCNLHGLWSKDVH